MGRRGEDEGLSKLGSQVRGRTTRYSAGPHSERSGKGGVPDIDHKCRYQALPRPELRWKRAENRGKSGARVGRTL